MVRVSRGFDIDLAQAHLRKHDRALARWMRKVEPVEQHPRWNKRFDTIDALARAILFQQLSGKAASTIVGRVEAATSSKLLHAAAFARADDPTLRACGVSGNKLLALRDLSAHAQRGEIPTASKMAGMSDEAIIAALSAVRGIGTWTAQMMLMFNLGRPDVLPVDDLGIRKGAQIVDGLEAMPTPRELAVRGEAWGPYRTLAGMYLWRIADATKPAPAPKKRNPSTTSTTPMPTPTPRSRR
ncbi:MAG TPA: DNA-3-methyladenine glycosylase 2 family protein [Xanthomonadaceae bacterium]|jgi:DNA-3-methyladenine glycosylase II|nr:DNA-3-methyladenine glycosylase 2 family protein [Xanthomonadaceae bacterium]